MAKDDSGFVVALLVAVVAGILLAGLGSFALVSAVAGEPDTVKPAVLDPDYNAL